MASVSFMCVCVHMLLCHGSLWKSADSWRAPALCPVLARRGEAQARRLGGPGWLGRQGPSAWLLEPAAALLPHAAHREGRLSGAPSLSQSTHGGGGWSFLSPPPPLPPVTHE